MSTLDYLVVLAAALVGVWVFIVIACCKTAGDADRDMYAEPNLLGGARIIPMRPNREREPEWRRAESSE